MLVYVYNLIIIMFNINFQYTNIHHIYTTTRQRNVYILTLWLFYTTFVVYKNYCFFFCCFTLV
jgi:hypothetical protein